MGFFDTFYHEGKLPDRGAFRGELQTKHQGKDLWYCTPTADGRGTARAWRRAALRAGLRRGESAACVARFTHGRTERLSRFEEMSEASRAALRTGRAS
jgi:hypothetical protein